MLESGTGKGSPSGGPVSKRTGGASIEGLMGKLGLLGFRLFFLDRLLVSRWEKSASSWINKILSSLRNRKSEESESDGERQKTSSESHYNRNMLRKMSILWNIQLFMTPAATARSYSDTFLSVCEVLEVVFPSRRFAFYLYPCQCHRRILCSIISVHQKKRRK